ncbi:MAG: hypothetical protein COA94_07375 [Rickettsiales bacterium]|nr:MAG: hypothetical protein COA94_07375 [Rickettsiales bacterium]
MSLFEFIVVLIVALLVVKPEDLPKIVKKFKQMQSFITNTKKEIISQISIDDELEEIMQDSSSPNLNKEMEQVNYYLEKISNIGPEYEGEYSLAAIKKHYLKLVKEKMADSNSAKQDSNS